MRFLVDVMCGSLARYLRMMGHEAAYAGDRGLERDDAVTAAARDEGRVVVTRDAALVDAADGDDVDAVLLEARDVVDQLDALHDATGIDLGLPEEPSRCSDCNGVLARTEERPDHAPDDVDAVWRCRDCGKRFWRGSHWDDVAETLTTVRSDGAA